MCLQWSRQNNVFTQSQREAPLSLLSPPESCPSPESCLPEAPNQDPGRRRSVGAQVMTCALASLLTWENLAIERRKGLQAYHYYLINPYEYNIEYYHRDLAWSSNQCGLFVQFLDFFCCNPSSMSSSVAIWSHIYITLLLRLTSSAATLSKRCCGFQATAVTGLPRSQQVSLQGVHGLDSVSMSVYLLFARCKSRSHLS